jgi:hypothetical protein
MSGRVRRKPSPKVLRAALGHRVDQQLHRRRRQPSLPHQQAGDRGEVGAGAVAADSDPRRIAAQPAGVGVRPPVGGEGVFGGRREGVLRGQAVVDREDVGAGVGGEEAAGPVVGVEVADHPAAAVVVDEKRRGCVRRARERHVVPRRDRPSGPGDLDRFHPRHRNRRPLADDLRLATAVRPRRGHRHPLGEAVLAGELGQLQQRMDVTGQRLSVALGRRPE